MEKSYFLYLSEIEIKIILKNVKHLYLRLDKCSSNATLVAPKKTNPSFIKSFVLSKIDWIKQHQEKIKARGVLPPKLYQSGEIHYLYGKPYLLLVTETTKKPIIYIQDEQLILQVKPETDLQKKQQLIEKWYREILKQDIASLISKWEPIMKVTTNEFGIKKMKTKWGTCNILAKRIWLNLELAKRPFHCLEYVVVHEMVHLLERNHTPKFHAFMTQFLPNWKDSKVILNEWKN
jgi:predicted metal-dependent hydrolase